MRRVVLIVGLVACGKSSERAKDSAPEPPPPPKATVPDAGATALDAAAEKKVDKKDLREILLGEGPVPAVTGQVLRGGALVDVATLELSAGGVHCRERGG